MNILIGNPGSSPELRHLALWLAKQDVEVTYASPVAVSAETMRKLRGIPVIGHHLASLAARRAIPFCNPSNVRIVKVATLPELLFRALQMLGLPRRVCDHVLDWRNRAFARALASEVRGRPPTVLVSQQGSCLEAIQAARESSVPVILNCPIVHVNRLWEVYAREGSSRFGFTLDFFAFHPRRVVRQMREIQLASKLLAYSETHAQSYVLAGVSREKILVAPLGVDVSLFPFRASRSSSGGNRALFVGQVTQRKGVSQLIQSLDYLPEDWTLTIVGRAEPRVKRELERERRIEYYPHVSRSELSEIYSRADAFVFPTFAEGFAQTPLEAMASGIPVVVSKGAYDPAGPIVHGESGVLVDPTNPKEIAEACKSVVADEELRSRMIRNAAARAQEYTWSRFSGVVYAEVINLCG